MYITASSTISYQPTFRNKNFSWKLSDLEPASELITPDYNPFIPAMERRRMSEVLKMAITCSIDCLEQSGVSQPDAIIVGTSMGCCVHTKNFLDKIVAANDGPISPTSFILSTHNSIAGQISILLKNHGYNMTHTQNSLSFEQGLIDGMLCFNDGFNNLLVGGADEKEDSLYNMRARLDDETILTSCGASFFILSNKKSRAADIRLVDVGSIGLVDEPNGVIAEFMASNQVSPEEIDLILYSNSDQMITDELKKIFGQKKMFNFQKISGTYFTNSAFAMHYGIDILSHKQHPIFGEQIKKVLVCNNVIPENLGLILLENNND
jgi:3-oxoacyl-[acyl-carrier-protein] synthase II